MSASCGLGSSLLECQNADFFFSWKFVSSLVEEDYFSSLKCAQTERRLSVQEGTL